MAHLFPMLYRLDVWKGRRMDTNKSQATPKNHNMVRIMRGILVHLNMDDTIDRVW